MQRAIMWMPRGWWLIAGLTLAVLWAVVPSAAGDPLPGQVLKFEQAPMLDVPIGDPTGVTRYHGHDELSTAWSFYDQIPGGPQQFRGYNGTFMADDFADRFDTPVVHVKFWGSYLNSLSQQPGAGPKVDKFLISFESDIPADPATGSFSRPGVPLLNQVVFRDTDGVLMPGEGAFTEKVAFPTSVDGPIYEYNAELHLGKEFFEQPDTVYWLKIVALVDVDPGVDPLADPSIIQWGWHNRDYTKTNPLASVPPAVVPGESIVGTLPDGTDIWHFQDNAVSGFVSVDPFTPGGLEMPEIIQDVAGPEHYIDLLDGPDGIGQFSKDLAFELYTIPEPATVALLGIGLLAMGRVRRVGQVSGLR